MIYLISDLHLNHDKPFIYTVRGYSSIEEMNTALIHNYNSVVTDEDDVYILGDLCLGGPDSLAQNYELLSQLQGCIHIILGNHDSPNRIKMYETLPRVCEVCNATTLVYRKYHFFLSHYPTLCGNFDDGGLRTTVISLCGHSHAKDPFMDWEQGIIYHCEVDAHDGFPVSIDTIIDDLKNRWKQDEERAARVVAALEKCLPDLD